MSKNHRTLAENVIYVLIAIDIINFAAFGFVAFEWPTKSPSRRFCHSRIWARTVTLVGACAVGGFKRGYPALVSRTHSLAENSVARRRDFADR